MLERFADIIDAWPEPSAATLSADLGVRPGLVRQWRHRDVIPSNHWARLVERAAARGIEGVSFDLLARLAAAGGDERPSIEPETEGAPANA